MNVTDIKMYEAVDSGIVLTPAVTKMSKEAKNCATMDSPTLAYVQKYIFVCHHIAIETRLE